jgi:hypothetical protein
MQFVRAGRLLAIAVLATLPLFPARNDAEITPAIQSALDHISADSMKGHVSFLASDLLQGRATPSPGLDVAAEYIAAQFRRAGLEPGGDDGYFQSAKFVSFEPDLEGFHLEIAGAGKPLSIQAAEARIQLGAPLDLTDAPAFKIAIDDPVSLAALKPEQTAGSVFLLFVPDLRRDSVRRASFDRTMTAVRRLKPALILAAGPSADRVAGRAKLAPADEPRDGASVIAVHNDEFVSLITPLASGATNLKITAHAKASIERPLTLRNVVAVLRGSDPVLKDSYILLTAHYDHIGIKPDGEGDRIYNGANDDASGTASVIEIASALATLNPRPRRSIVFIALFGEEAGLLGSLYYAHHPLFPLVRTIADVNLEQLGRTDSGQGPKIASASFTGFDFSDLPVIFEKAGEKTGMKVYKDAQRSDPFFSRSDNQALADMGVPAHTVCVAFEFPDYHGVGDEWPKLDYANMAKVDRMVALGLVSLADAASVPHWNATEAKASRYLKAWERLHEGSAAAQ